MIVAETVEYEGFVGYVARPPTDAPRPGIVLAHDWSGLNAGTRAAADRLAGMGHPCFAIDVYGASVRGDELGDNSQLMQPLLDDRVELQRRLLIGLAAATRHPAFVEERVVTVGFCFGGLCALDLARAAPPQLRGAISVHGVLRPPAFERRTAMHARVLLLHGWEDPFAPPQDVVAIARELTEAGADWQLHAYGHALHAFTFDRAQQPERGLQHHALAERRAWLAIEHFLAELLG